MAASDTRSTITVNPFLANFPISYTLKTQENFWFSGVFKGFKMEALATNRLIVIPELLQRDRRIENWI